MQTDYGDEIAGLIPWELFDEADARRALSMAERVVSLGEEIIREVAGSGEGSALKDEVGSTSGQKGRVISLEKVKHTEWRGVQMVAIFQISGPAEHPRGRAAPSGTARHGVRIADTATLPGRTGPSLQTTVSRSYR